MTQVVVAGFVTEAEAERLFQVARTNDARFARVAEHARSVECTIAPSEVQWIVDDYARGALDESEYTDMDLRVLAAAARLLAKARRADLAACQGLLFDFGASVAVRGFFSDEDLARANARCAEVQEAFSREVRERVENVRHEADMLRHARRAADDLVHRGIKMSVVAYADRDAVFERILRDGAFRMDLRARVDQASRAWADNIRIARENDERAARAAKAAKARRSLPAGYSIEKHQRAWIVTCPDGSTLFDKLKGEAVALACAHEASAATKH